MKRVHKYLLALALCLPFFLIGCSDSDSVDNTGGGGDGGGITPDEFQIVVQPKPFLSEGGEQILKFKTPAKWSITGAPAWVKLSPTKGEAGLVEVKITTEPNDTYDERNATMRLLSGFKNMPLTIVQKQKDALTVTTAEFKLKARATTITIEAKTNIDIKCEIQGDGKSWIEAVAANETRGLVSKTFNFKVKENEQDQKREATILVQSADGKKTETVKVYQEGKIAELILTKNEYMIDETAQEIQIVLEANTEYEMKIPAEVDWITEKKTRAYSTHTRILNITENKSKEQRSAKIEFTYMRGSKQMSEFVTIIQGAALSGENSVLRFTTTKQSIEQGNLPRIKDASKDLTSDGTILRWGDGSADDQYQWRKTHNYSDGKDEHTIYIEINKNKRPATFSLTVQGLKHLDLSHF